jgi:hypothetical protein
VEGCGAVGVGARGTGDAALGVVEANVLRASGGGKREQQKRDGDDSRGRSHRCPQSERGSGENWLPVKIIEELRALTRKRDRVRCTANAMSGLISVGACVTVSQQNHFVQRKEQSR